MRNHTSRRILELIGGLSLLQEGASRIRARRARFDTSRHSRLPCVVAIEHSELFAPDFSGGNTPEERDPHLGVLGIDESVSVSLQEEDRRRIAGPLAPITERVIVRHDAFGIQGRECARVAFAI